MEGISQTADVRDLIVAEAELLQRRVVAERFSQTADAGYPHTSEVEL